YPGASSGFLYRLQHRKLRSLRGFVPSRGTADDAEPRDGAWATRGRAQPAGDGRRRLSKSTPGNFAGRGVGRHGNGNRTVLAFYPQCKWESNQRSRKVSGLLAQARRVADDRRLLER